MTTPVVAVGAGGDRIGVLARAAAALRAGEVVAIPTDTVYGLAVDPTRPGATARVFAAKGRPAHVALPVLVADREQADSLTADVGTDARRLMATWWPGPLTVVVARRAGLGLDLGGDPTTIGLRCPAHGVARSLAADVGPLATTSANRHGAVPATDAAGVLAGVGRIGLVVDGGTCAGEASTVVDCTGRSPRILRRGAVPWAEVLTTLRQPPI